MEKIGFYFLQQFTEGIISLGETALENISNVIVKVLSNKIDNTLKDVTDD